MDQANDNPEANGSTSPPSQKRQRAKQACEPCRLRKRRCDSAIPCNMCTQFDYKCYYEKHPRKRSKLVEQSAIHDLATGDFIRAEAAKEDRSTLEDISKLRSMEANSGIAFTRLLGQRLDPSSGPKLFTFGWNLGANLGTSTNLAPPPTPISDFLGQDQMYEMAKLYFQNVHPLYGFLDQDYVMEQISVRWAQPHLCKIPDHLFAGIVAGGSLFTSGPILSLMPSIVDSAKKALDIKGIMTPPALVDVQSWLLRGLYMRATDHPHAVHMTSCIIMHLVEAAGLHQEIAECAMRPPNEDRDIEAEQRRRTFWVARMLNTWVSFEYGRTRVHLRGITAHLPTPRGEGDFTRDYVNLYSLSSCLDPERDDSKWEEFLLKLEDFDARHDGIELSRANLAMCGYRRLRLANPNLSTETLDRIIRIGLQGLEAARRMTEKGMSWWHVANVPFQVVCVFLAMDVRESLAHVGASLRVLELVYERFQTIAMKEALKSARFLVRLSKKRKDEDSEVLSVSLKNNNPVPVEEDPRPENLEASSDLLNGKSVPVQVGETPATVTSSNEDWSLDVLNHTDFDWNFFLSADMPTFNGFAPDGTM